MIKSKETLNQITTNYGLKGSRIGTKLGLTLGTLAGLGELLGDINSDISDNINNVNQLSNSDINSNIIPENNFSHLNSFPGNILKDIALGGILGATAGYIAGKGIGYIAAPRFLKENQSLSRRLKEVN
jgi:hypothetical protein